MTTLVNQLITPTRDQIRDKWLRSYSIRNPGADTSEDSLPYIRASTYADAAFPLYANAKTIANATSLAGMSTEDLTAFGIREGIPDPAGKPASGSLGFVVADTSAGGATVQGSDFNGGPGTGLEMKSDSGVVLNVVTTGKYSSPQPIAIAAKSTGTATNLPAGTTLTVTNPPYGLNPKLVVMANPDGSGLTGGRAAETDPERVARFSGYLANPPSAGNDAAYQTFVESIPGLAVQKCFTYPAADGPGTTGIVFTMRAAMGASRVPNAAQVALVASQVAGAFPADDGQFFPALVSVPVNIGLGVRWSRTAADWVDASPWPLPNGTNAPAVSVYGPAPTVSSCRISWPSGGMSTAVPYAGQTIGLFNASAGTFVAKRILTANLGTAGTGESRAWDVTFDLTASDPSYVPVAGGLVSPWSDSLPLLAQALVPYFQGTGPGESFGDPFDAGQRRKRQPESPAWVQNLDTPMLVPLLQLPAVSHGTVLFPALPYVCPLGTGVVSVNLLELSSLAAYPA